MWSTIGVVDRRVNTKRHICSDPGPCHRFEAKSSQFFASFNSLVVLTILSDSQMPTSRDLAIFMPTTTTTDGQTDYFTPSVHVHRV